MQIDDLTPEHARELAKPGAWTVQALLDKLPHVHPWWMRDAVESSCEDRPELERRIVALMEVQTSELARLYMGLVLFFLAHPLGREAFMAGLRSEDAAQRKLVLDQFRILRPDDLGRDGVAGKLPATCEEVLAAVVPLLQEPASYQGNVALDFALSQPVFALGLSYTRPLLTHSDQAVRDKIALAYLNHGRDDGALDALTEGLFAPGTFANPNEASLSGRESACFALKACAQNAADPGVRVRAGEMALRVVQQTLRAREAQGRFPQWSEEGLATNALFEIIVLTRPAGAEQVLLHEAIGSESETVHLRSRALLSYVELSGKVPPQAQSIIDALVTYPQVHALDDRLNQLVARKLIGLPTLLTAARNPAWCYMATQAIAAWPRGGEDSFTVDGLIVALSAMAGRTPPVEDGAIDCLAGLLLRFPRTAAQDRAIIAALNQALGIAKQNADRPWVAQKVLHQLVMFGEVSADEESDFDPWDAMLAHWQRNSIDWVDVPRMLVEAGVMDEADQATRDEGDAGSDDEREFREIDVPSQLCGILGDRFVPAGLKDEGYTPRHHLLLEKMAAIVLPVLGTDAYSQAIEWRGNSAVCRVRFVYQDRVYGFDASPIGDWLDVWAVIDGFNGFLSEIGRAERFFRLADPDAWGGEWGILLCAHGERFAKVNERLRLPLQPR